jgi:hypothetical protein
MANVTTSKTLTGCPSQIDIGGGHRSHIMIGLARNHDVAERAIKSGVTKNGDMMVVNGAHDRRRRGRFRLMKSGKRGSQIDKEHSKDKGLLYDSEGELSTNQKEGITNES